MERPHRAAAQRRHPLLLAKPQPRRPGNFPFRGLRLNLRRRETGRPRSPNPAERPNRSSSRQLLHKRSNRLRTLRSRQRNPDWPSPRRSVPRRRAERHAATRSRFPARRIIDPASPGNLREYRRRRPPHRGRPPRRPPRSESRITVHGLHRIPAILVGPALIATRAIIR